MAGNVSLKQGVADAQEDLAELSPLARPRQRNRPGTSMVLLKPRELEAIASSQDRRFTVSKLAGVRPQRAQFLVVGALSKSLFFTLTNDALVANCAMSHDKAKTVLMT